jgi:hypothetical protein
MFCDKLYIVPDVLLRSKMAPEIEEASRCEMIKLEELKVVVIRLQRMLEDYSVLRDDFEEALKEKPVDTHRTDQCSSTENIVSFMYSGIKDSV